MKRMLVARTWVFLLVVLATAYAALIVPTDVQQPGTQPGEVGNLESPDKCDNCHGGYNTAVEPAFNWRGSMMAQAARDPIFWATVAVAEQDFDGAGDLCLRCHTPEGWLGGRSTPTDGSGLAAGDADGVTCDTCHKMTNPDNSEHIGVQNPPFVANDGTSPSTGYYGSGMYSMWAGAEKLGPYASTVARHQFLQSRFHRSQDFCGTCHDVSNPVVGDLAHNNGAQPTADAVVASGVPGTPVDGKAAFNNFPYKYGVVERTYSEFRSGLLSRTRVADYASLPSELKAGAIKAAYDAARGDYADGTTRYFTCQTCHMRAVSGQGCNKAGAPLRSDLPLHDMTGGNYWVPEAILYQNSQGTLRLGGGLTSLQIQALEAGKVRARQQLAWAAALSVTGNTLRVTNLTGHKLISGYPEGRRMWLNVRWYDGGGGLLREDGRYGTITANVGGTPTQVRTLLDPDDPNTRVYEAHYGITQEWASQLVSLGYPASLPLSYDRATGAATYTLGELASQPPGTHHESLRFVLSNTVVRDNRIPPYGMSYDEARRRNALPVPRDQFGNPGAGGVFRHWDDVSLNPPASAAWATIDLLYQPTSWEYVQFLYLANDRQNAFLGAEGENLLRAWLATGMAEPHTMASATWGTPPAAPGTFQGTVRNANTNAPIADALVQTSGGFAGTTSGSGTYSISLPANTYSATASRFGYQSSSASGIVVASGSTTTQDFNLVPIPILALGTVTADDSGGNGNGVVDLNECVGLTLALQNQGAGDATGIAATLSTTTPGVSVVAPSSAYPNIAGGGSGSNSTAFRIETSPSFVVGTVIELALQVTTGQGSFGLTLNLDTGTPDAAAVAFSAAGPVSIPDDDPAGASLPLTVSGITSAISKVKVTLHITHTFDADLTIKLIGPDGTTVTLAAGVGGSADNFGSDCPADGNDTTFDDAAATSIVAGTAPFVGTFRPTGDLSAFKGKSGAAVNGTWTLKVVDGFAIGIGNIECWSLSINGTLGADGGGPCQCSTPPEATVAGNTTICVGASTTVQAALTGVAPWSVTWSDGFVQNVSSSPAIHSVTPGTTTVYSVIAVSDASCAGTSSGSSTVTIDPSADCGSFFTVTPCRLVDTRAGQGPALAADSTRSFDIGGLCGVPSDAKAVTVVLAAVDETTAGNLRLFPAGGASPSSSTINFVANQARANNAIVPLGASGRISVLCAMSAGTTHFVMDVNGYFK